jgi:hypothetical protein
LGKIVAFFHQWTVINDNLWHYSGKICINFLLKENRVLTILSLADKIIVVAMVGHLLPNTNLGEN